MARMCQSVQPVRYIMLGRATFLTMTESYFALKNAMMPRWFGSALPCISVCSVFRDHLGSQEGLLGHHARPTTIAHGNAPCRRLCQLACCWWPC